MFNDDWLIVNPVSSDKYEMIIDRLLMTIGKEESKIIDGKSIFNHGVSNGFGQSVNVDLQIPVYR